MSQNRLILCLNNIEDCQEAKKNDIRFYLGYPIGNMFEVEPLVALGVCYIRIGIPLFFNMAQVATIPVPIRAVPNIAYIDGLPRENGIHGQWIRPEDVETYEPYVSCLEFENCHVKREQALFRIYAVEHKWPGEVDAIISNMNYPALNRMILPEVAQFRLTCKQTCVLKNNCHICDNAFKLASDQLMKEFLENFEPAN